jgi:dCMP deaminase
MAEERISWNEYFIEITKLIAKRASCPRKQVGALIVKNNKIIASGYNGSPKGMLHCSTAGCIIKNNHCTRVIHAEMNALLQAGKESQDAKLYCTCLPCEICFKLCIQAGIKEIIYLEDYNKEDVSYWIDNGGIRLTKWKKK